MPPFTIIGHRGACAHEPENTLRSIRRAITDGADMVELDVRFAAGEIIVIHDETLDRTTDGRGSIYEKSSAELRRVDAGRGERIPTLMEAIEQTLPALPLNIEMKDCAVSAPVCELLASLTDLDPNRILISSFHEAASREAREKLPAIPIGILSQGDPESISAMFELADELGAISLHPHVDSVSKELIRLAHSAGYRVLPYTARTVDQLQHLLDCGADGCFADDPRWAAELSR